MSQMNTPMMPAASPFIGVNPSGVDPNAAIEQIGVQQRSYLQRIHEQKMQQAQQQFNASQNAADRQQQVDIVNKQMAFQEKMADRERKDRLFYEQKAENIAFETRRLDDQIAKLRAERQNALAENAKGGASKLDSEINALKEQKKKLSRQYQHLAVLQEARNGLFSTQNISQDGQSMAGQMFRGFSDTIASDQARVTGFTDALSRAVQTSLESSEGTPSTYTDGQWARTQTVDAIAKFLGIDSASETKAKIMSMINAAEFAASKTGEDADFHGKHAAQLWQEIVASGVSERDLVRAITTAKDVIEGDAVTQAKQMAAQARVQSETGGGPKLKDDELEAGIKKAGMFDPTAAALGALPNLMSRDGKPMSQLWDEADRDLAGEMQETIINVVMAISKRDNLEDLLGALEDADGTTESLRKQGEVELAMLFEDMHPDFRQAMMERVEEQLRLFTGSQKVRGANSSLKEYGYEGRRTAGALTDLEKAQDDLDATLERLTNEVGTAGAGAAIDINKQYDEAESAARSDSLNRVRGLSQSGGERGVR